MNTFYIPTVHQGLENIQKMLLFGQQVLSATDRELCFSFERCRWIMPFAIAYLGGLCRLMEYQGRQVKFEWTCAKPEVHDAMLARNGFMEAFGAGLGLGSSTAVPYAEDQTANKSVQMSYLRNDWLGRGWINISDLLRDAIAGQVYEIYDNGFTHAKSPIGLISLGQYYRQNHELRLTVVDFGVSIPGNVREYLQKPELEASAALQWALQRGKSTKHALSAVKDDVGRGVGLDLLKNFISTNKGKLQIFSGQGYVSIDANDEQYHNLDVEMPGTLVNITLKCDDAYYHLASEESLKDEPWF